jgi:hypothetical protein
MKEPLMKRLLLVLLIVGCLLVVVAPASATTLTGTFTGGTAVREPVDPPVLPSTIDLRAVGSVTIVVGAARETSGALRVTAPGNADQGPFPYTLALRNFFLWNPGKWVGNTYVVTGTIGDGSSREDPRFDVTLTMPRTRGATFNMHVEITNSYFFWDYWDFSGVVR